jgi:hypothetical protein
MNEGYNNTGSNKYYYQPQAQQQQENNYGYPQPSNNYYQPQQQATPLPQRVSSVTTESYPPIDTPSYAMPQPYQHQQQTAGVYPPPQYTHSSNHSQGSATSPPGSPQPPPMSFPSASQQQSYGQYQPINGGVYPPPAATPAVVDPTTQDMISNSYRPTFTNHVSDSTTTSSTSSNTTPPVAPYNSGRPVPAQPVFNTSNNSNSSQKHRRHPSSLRSNMIMTIERPRYNYLPENTDQLNENEMPFIPVSPDTDSDDDEYFTGAAAQQPQQHKVNEYQQQETAPVDNIWPPPSAGETSSTPPPPPQPKTDYNHVATAPQQEQQGDTAIYDDPTQFYVYPPPIDRESTPTQQSVTAGAPALPRHEEPIIQQQQEPKAAAEPNYGLLSVLSTAFIRHVKGLEHVRELWCASEYNESFTGSEAVTIIKSLLKEQVPEDYCVIVANALMRCRPNALFSPTQYSQRSLISNTMYNSDDTYFLEEDNCVEENLPKGVIPSLTPCYSYACKPGQGGCYSERCPNNGKDFINDNKVRGGGRVGMDKKVRY